MAIQMRRGLEADFNPDKMKPGEWAVSLDKKYVRMCFAPGLCFRMATYESFEKDMQEIQNILASVNSTKEAIDAIKLVIDEKATIVTEKTEQASQYADVATQKAQEATNASNSASESATNANTYAANASNSADIAATKATEASQSASNANASSESASNSAETATLKANDANTSATNARNSADIAQSNATLSKSYAVGGTGTREGEDADNAKYYYEKAKAVTNVDIATTDKAGIVKPDGTSVTVDPDGTLHAQIGTKLEKEIISDEWNASTTYAVGQYCIYNNLLWKCLVQHNGQTPTEGTYWTKVSVANEIASVNSSLNNLSDNYVLKTQISNPNLFDNPWLTINQRGLLEYNNNNSYCFDRWIFQNMSESASININENNTVSITTKNNDGICQILSKALEMGETYTISFNEGYRISSKTFVWNGANIVQLYDGAATVKFAVINNGTAIYPYIRYEDTVATGNIVAFKLEKGSISTLAMDTDPNYALELIKCSMSTIDPSDTYANKKITFS